MATLNHPVSVDLTELAARIEHDPEVLEDWQAEGRAPELWEAYEELELARTALAARLRALALEPDVPGSEGVPLDELCLEAVMEADDLDQDESELIGQAYWLDLGDGD